MLHHHQPHHQTSPKWFQTVAKLTIKTTLFLATEWILGSVGLDTLADYTEFLSSQADLMLVSQTDITMVNQPIGQLNYAA
ncbi:hypothetical protein ACN4EG_25865 [Alkalinema pantanalense CENA528]|uniref:hypothetical protein n=1 Tax=Alkalinema pantanalense TaxID=1620705 RepID=UPI003D6FB4E9